MKRVRRATERPIRRPIDSIEAAEAYLEGLINRERGSDYVYERLDLRPIRALLDGLGRPESRLSIIHVAGSKGKGSTCLYAEAILIALGERVGTFTSPHLERWTERFRIDGEPVSDRSLVEAVERVRPVVERLRAGPRETQPSFFDATTAVAFLLFADAQVDRAVIEVGLGGRLDSTNVVAPAVTCITNIELEHTDKLGGTHAAIAAEKAGILKPGVPSVLGRLTREADEVIRERARRVGAPILELPDDFDEGSTASRDAAAPLRLSLVGLPSIEVGLANPGAAARSNAALAIQCVHALAVHGPEALGDAAIRGLAACRLPGRTERLVSDPQVLLDSAHTGESARSLAEVLESIAPEGFELLFSISRDKDFEAVIAPLLARVERIWATRADPIRSLPADQLAKRIELAARAAGRPVPVACEVDPARAAREARAALAPRRMLVVTGSVYLAGVARRVLADAAGPD